MSLLVVGSVAFDTVKTPFGEVDEALGGSALYFSTSASYFTDVDLVGVVGEDFPRETVQFLEQRGINVEGLERTEGRTFRWEGKYGYDLQEPETLDTQLNVFGDFEPELPPEYRDNDVVFLANIDPEIQIKVLEQVENPDFVALDTMNFWIEGKKEALERALGRVDMAVINEMEARELAEEPNIVRAAESIQSLGPSHVAVKRGEYGALLFTPDDTFFAPGFPLESIYDPTGAGDTFAGGLLGFLDRQEGITETTLRQSTVMGCVMASYCVEQFSLDGLKKLETDNIHGRAEKFYELVQFRPVEPFTQ